MPETTPHQSIVTLLLKRLDIKKFFLRTLSDPSAQLLIVGNLFTIILAIVEGWSAATILWSYWVQSIIIGLFTVIRILVVQLPKTDSRQSDDNFLGRLVVAGFFIFHYGMFHVVYAVFLAAFGLLEKLDMQGMFWMTAIFTVMHAFSFWQNTFHRPDGTDKKENMGQIFMSPYSRIVPMHLTIIFGSIFILAGLDFIAILIFLTLKTLADVIGHQFKHSAQGTEPT
jgi:hypothetical protein